MEKQKKIKIRKSSVDGYWTNTTELQNALQGIDLGYYTWIMSNRRAEIFLSESSIKELNKIWKNRKR